MLSYAEYIFFIHFVVINVAQYRPIVPQIQLPLLAACLKVLK